MSLLLSFALLAPRASAAEGPTLYFREVLGAALFPTGALSATRLEVRTPLYRSRSKLFQATYSGVGLGLQVSPAFLGIGPRLSFAPVDIFDVNLSAARVAYFDDGLGLIPYDVTSGRTGLQRSARSAEGFGSGAWTATIEPTLKLKVGPIVAFDTWTFDLLHIEHADGVDERYTYEPLRGIIVAYDDLTVDQQAAVLVDPLPAGGPSFRAGLIVRDRFAVVSGDRTTSGGVLVAVRPGVKPAIPTLLAVGQLYLHDPDRAVLSAPNVAVAARWEVDSPLRAQPPAP